MGYVKTKGIVIKEVNTGEADRIVTVFSKGFGKLSGTAKNSRRPKNRLSAGTQLLCYSDFVMYKGKDIYTITSSEVIQAFYEIRNDMVKLTHSAHMLELVNDVVQENQPASKLLQLFLNTLHMLAKTDKSPELLTRIFELRLMAILGYSPWVRGCISCECQDTGILHFSFKKCGFICKACLVEDKAAIGISAGAAKAINHIIHANLDELFNFSLSESVLMEIGRITRRYLKERLDKEYKKLDFLKELDL